MIDSEFVARYLAGIGTLRKAVEGLTAEEVRARPVPGTWTTLEVLCHLADTEALFAERMKRVLVEDRPPLPVADPDRYSASLAYDMRDAAEEVAVVEAIRKQMARILAVQPTEAWQRVGIHSTDGEKSLEQIATKAIAHLEHHLDFIRAKREALKKIN
jgi:uncharacterized damage-inducible protein DinB